jgi:hypothetical protein
MNKKMTMCWWCEKTIIIRPKQRVAHTLKATRDHLIPRVEGGGLGVVLDYDPCVLREVRLAPFQQPLDTARSMPTTLAILMAR